MQHRARQFGFPYGKTHHRLGRALCTGAALLTLGGAGARWVLGQDKPNIIVVVTDDQGLDAVAGASWPNFLNVHTPNLAAMAAHGRTFSYARVAPSCSPTRASLLTGRQPLRTGVTFRLNDSDDARLVRLQDHEHTLAELLHEAGYYTILIDKWHVGGSPVNQGFDFYLPTHRILHLDDPIRVGDEHITRTVNIAERAVTERPDPNQPYALFFWTIDPHYRKDHTGQEPWGWWKVDESLLPSGEDYYAPGVDSPQNRYRAVVEALDTEVGRMLQELGVANSQFQYLPGSNTVVFYLSDNGTPDRVAAFPERSKKSLYELGIRVPFVAFGQRVPGDGAILNRLVSHVDLYDTIGDIIGTPMNQRGSLPRDGMSFSDAIGWSSGRPEREFTLSSLGGSLPEKHRVALANTRFKLTARGGGAGLGPLSLETFVDLQHDPAESHNLLRSNLTPLQRTAYLTMSDALTDYWNSCVNEPTVNIVDVPITHILAMTSTGQRQTQILPLGWLGPDQPDAVEARVFIRFDASAIDGLIPNWATFDDVIGAQIVTVFRSDSDDPDETDTGPIHAYGMLGDWYSHRVTWDEVVNGYDGNLDLGQVDLPEHIVADLRAAGLSGIPLDDQTPVSLGHSSDLLERVRAWHDDPYSNHGVVLMTDIVPDIGGDQSIRLRPYAFLRLTLAW